MYDINPPFRALPYLAPKTYKNPPNQGFFLRKYTFAGVTRGGGEVGMVVYLMEIKHEEACEFVIESEEGGI